MSQHPCKAGPNGAPCKKVDVGQAFNLKKHCRLCWLFTHDRDYNVAWGGDGKVVSAPSAPAEAKAAAPKPVLLGDAVEAALSAVGITKDRIEKWLGAPCGCAKRQRKLNDLHQWVKHVKSIAVETARGWLAKIIGS